MIRQVYNMARQVRCENFQLLHHVTSFTGISSCTALAIEQQGDRQNQRRNLPSRLIQASSSEIRIYSNFYNSIMYYNSSNYWSSEHLTCWTTCYAYVINGRGTMMVTVAIPVF